MGGMTQQGGRFRWRRFFATAVIVLIAAVACGLWFKGDVAQAIQLRRLIDRAEHGTPDERAAIARQAGEWALDDRPICRSSRFAALLDTLMAHGQPSVRLRVLRANLLIGRTEMLGGLANDDDPLIARHAAIVESLTGACACAWPVGVLMPPRWQELTDGTARTLGRYESAGRGSLAIISFDGMGDLVRAFAVRAAQEAAVDDLWPALGSDHASVRHVALLVAVERFGEAACKQLARELMATSHDEHRMSGALLAGLVGGPGDLLEDQWRREEVWLVRQHLAAARYMLGIDESWAVGPAEGLLVRRDFPDGAVWLAMLHRGDRRALDQVFKPFESNAGEMVDLFNRRRFGFVLRRHLPELPAFWLYAETKTQHDLADLLQDWYLLHRNRLVFDPQAKQFRVSQ